MLERDKTEKVHETQMGVSLDDETHSKFKMLALKEHKKIKELTKELILDYIKKHGDGNPAFTLDQWQDNDQMKAVPAFFRTADDWEKYLYSLPESELQEIIWQSQTIGARAQKRMNMI